jgi:GT2 family glycosyltransferase
VKVVLGVIHDASMDSPFVWSLFDLIRKRENQIIGAISVGGGAGRLDNARNEVAKRFLKVQSEWLLTLDTDMVFSVENFDALLASADPDFAPIVSGIYFVDERPPRAAAANTVGDSIKSISDWEEDKLIPVEWCGAGFMLIHRSVFEKLGDEPYRQDIVAPSGALVGEDYSFCERARQAGFTIQVNPSVFVGHVKPRILGFDI